MTDKNWQALAAATQRRRTQLGLNQEALAARRGPSGRTVRDIEQATQTRYTAKTFRDLEEALGWRFGLVEDVLAGVATEEEVMPAAAPSDSAPSDPHWARRNEAAARYADIAARIRGDVKSGRLDAAPGYHLELRAEAGRLRLLGVEAPRPVTFRSEPVPALIRDALAGPDPTAGLPPDQGGSPFEMHAEGFSYTTIGKYMVARDRRNRSS